jgi:hypothetical protein
MKNDALVGKPPVFESPSSTAPFDFVSLMEILMKNRLFSRDQIQGGPHGE